MLAEIEADLSSREPYEEDPKRWAYQIALLEIGSGKPNVAYVHNVLATVLGRPRVTA